MKLERNDLCICGSNKKNKDCCERYKIDDKELNDLIFEAINLATTPSEKELIEGINKLESYLTYNLTNIGSKYNILSNLAMAYHNRGDDEKAINLINRAQKDHEKLRTDIFFNIVKAISFSALGDVRRASSLAKRAISRPDFDEEMFGLLYIELGKIFNQNNDFDDAVNCYKKAVSFSRKKRDKLHEERALANLSLIKMLHSDTPEIRKEGLHEIIENSNKKNETGDLEGLSTNYCNIALYYLNEKDFKGVLSYAKKDLFIYQ